MKLEFVLYHPKRNAENGREESIFVVNDENIRKVLSETNELDVALDTMKLAVVIKYSDFQNGSESKLDKETTNFLKSIDIFKKSFYKKLIDFFSDDSNASYNSDSFSSEVSKESAQLVELFYRLPMNK